RPDQIIVGGERGREALERRGLTRATPLLGVSQKDTAVNEFYLFDWPPDDVGPSVNLFTAIEELRIDGIVAQPNHVLFAHDACCCRPHPADRCGGLAASPVYASPVYASPVYASPVYASPVYASPVYASPVYASAARAGRSYS